MKMKKKKWKIKKWKYSQTEYMKKLIKEIIDRINDDPPNRAGALAMLTMPKALPLISEAKPDVTPLMTKDGLFIEMFNPKTSKMEVVASFTHNGFICADRISVGNLRR